MAAQAVFGGELAWWSDIAPGPTKVMRYHHPGVPNIGDLRVVDWDTVSPVGILTAGYPCQPFSNAGKRLGTEDPRHLWPWIAYAIARLRPGIVVLENVSAHIRRGFRIVAADLAALGYRVTWTLLRACDVGAPHRRERLFVLATAHADGRERDGGEQAPVGSAVSRTALAWGGGQADANPDRANGPRAGRPGTGPSAWSSATGRGGWEVVADPHRDGCEGRQEHDRESVRPGESASLGCDLDRCDVPPRKAIADSDRTGLEGSESAGRLIVPAGGGAVPDPTGLGRRERGAEYAGIKWGSDAPDSRQPLIDWQEYEPAIRRWELCLGRPAPAPSVLGPRGGVKVSPAFGSWLMGLPDGYITDVPGLSINEQLRLIGNGVVPQQAAHALRWLLAQHDG